jgi:hypothetical protein
MLGADGFYPPFVLLYTGKETVFFVCELLAILLTIKTFELSILSLHDSDNKSHFHCMTWKCYLIMMPFPCSSRCFLVLLGWCFGAIEKLLVKSLSKNLLFHIPFGS